MNAKLAKLAFTGFGNSKADKPLTEEVQRDHNLDKKSGKYVKTLFPPDFIKPITQAQGQVRAAHKGLTLPWTDGLRLLADKTIGQWQEALENGRETIVKAVADQLTDYTHEKAPGLSGFSAAMATARAMHNGTFRLEEYPTNAEEFARCFTLETEIWPIPTGSQIAMDGLSAETLASMRDQLDQANQARTQAAIADVWNRILDPMRKLAGTLADPKATFKDTLVGNVLESIDAIPALNVTNDPRLIVAAQEIRDTLTGITPQTLRDSGQIRQRIQASAAALASKFGVLGSRKLSTPTTTADLKEEEAA